MVSRKIYRARAPEFAIIKSTLHFGVMNLSALFPRYLLLVFLEFFGTAGIKWYKIELLFERSRWTSRSRIVLRASFVSRL